MANKNLGRIGSNMKEGAQFGTQGSQADATGKLGSNAKESGAFAAKGSQSKATNRLSEVKQFEVKDNQNG